MREQGKVNGPCVRRRKSRGPSVKSAEKRTDELLRDSTKPPTKIADEDMA